MNNKLKVAVLMGGIGTERQVSIDSGNNVAQALMQAGIEVETVDLKPDDLRILDDSSIDVFFLALHGEFGEDGQLQQILEEKGLVYTGSGPVASRVAMDKIASKRAFAKAGVNVPSSIEFTHDSDIAKFEKELSSLSDKYVVKPIKQGSSVGVSIVSEPLDVIATAESCLIEFGDCMVEEFIGGREITVGINGDKALPIIEICSQSGFYDYQAKYIDDNTKYLFGTIEDSNLEKEISTASIKCFRSLGCVDFGRVDFMLSDDNIPYALEVNTIPGFTTHSLLPKAAAKAGISMSEFCMEIVNSSLKNKKKVVSEKY